MWLPGPSANVNLILFDNCTFFCGWVLLFSSLWPLIWSQESLYHAIFCLFLFITLCLIFALIKFLFNHRSSFLFVVFVATICYGMCYSCDPSGYEAPGTSSFTLLWCRTDFMHMDMTATLWLGKIKEVPAISASSGAPYGSGLGHSCCENF